MKRIISISTLLFIFIMLFLGSSHKNVNVYKATFPNTVSSMQNQKLKLFLERLQSQGFDVGEVKKIDKNEAIKLSSLGRKSNNQLQEDAMSVGAKDEYLVELDGQNVEIYDCSNFTTHENEESIKHSKENKKVGVIDQSSYDSKNADKVNYIWYTQLYNDHIMMMFKEHKSEQKLKEIFN